MEEIFVRHNNQQNYLTLNVLSINWPMVERYGNCHYNNDTENRSNNYSHCMWISFEQYLQLLFEISHFTQTFNSSKKKNYFLSELYDEYGVITISRTTIPRIKIDPIGRRKDAAQCLCISESVKGSFMINSE